MMARITLTAVALAVGFALGAYATGDDTPSPPITAPTGPNVPSPPSNPFFTQDSVTANEAQSLSGLAAQLHEEAARRERLEAQLLALQAKVQGIATQLQMSANSAPAATEHSIDNAAASLDDQPQVSEAAFIAAGFRQDQATELKRHVDQLALDRLFLRDRAMREDWLNSPRYRDELAKLAEKETSLRDQLGVSGYDRFLYATGEPNRLVIRSVMEGSPAQQAGLRGGDLLLSYDRARVFNWSELRAGLFAGNANEQVAVEVEREGQRLDVVLPRGPLGVRLDTARVKP